MRGEAEREPGTGISPCLRRLLSLSREPLPQLGTAAGARWGRELLCCLCRQGLGCLGKCFQRRTAAQGDGVFPRRAAHTVLWDGSFPKLRSEETRGERSLEFSSSAPSCSRSAEPLPCRPAGNVVGEPAAAAGAGPATAARELQGEAEHQRGPSEQSPGMGPGGRHCQGGAGCDVLRPLSAHCPGTSGTDSSITAAQLLNPV